MKQCSDVEKDYIQIQIFEIKQLYFKKKYLICAEKINKLLIETSQFKGISKMKRDILSYKRLIDFGIEEHYLKTGIKIF